MMRRRSRRASRAILAATAFVVWSETDGAVAATQVTGSGSFACALGAGGGVECWGENGHGQLGDGTTTHRQTPAGVSGLGSGVASIDAGPLGACAVTTGGGVRCWGDNAQGQLGDGTTTDSTVPVDVTGLGSGVASVSTSGANCNFDANFQSHACAVTAAGGVKCWGGNAKGQLGDGTNTGRTTPVDVVGLASGVVSVAASGCHTCAVTAAGGVKCWGYNRGGRLGDGTDVDRNTPVDVVGLASGIVSVSGGSGRTCALTASGAVKCWGYLTLVGQGEYTPIDITGFSGPVSSLSADSPGCAVLTTGAVECFSSTAAPVPFLSSGVAALSSGVTLMANGNVKSGYLGYGPLARYGWDPGCVIGYGDADGDAICDVYDPCATGPGGRLADRPRSRLAVARFGDGVPGNEDLTLNGNFHLPAGTSFADLDPVTHGVRALLFDPEGLIAEIALAPGTYAGPGSAGWVATANGKTWRYIDLTGGSATAVRFTLADRGKGQPGGLVRTTLRSNAATLPIGPTGVAGLGAAFVLGDALAGDAGLCGDAVCAASPAMHCTIR